MVVVVVKVMLAFVMIVSIEVDVSQVIGSLPYEVTLQVESSSSIIIVLRIPNAVDIFLQRFNRLSSPA